MSKLVRMPVWTVVAALAVTTAFFVGGAGVMAAPARAPGPTQEQMAAMSPAQQDAVMHPLNILANALDTVGRGSETGTYGGLELDAQAGTVDLYLVDTGRSTRFLSEAARQDGSIDLSRVHVMPAAHSRAQLDAARDRLLATGAPPGYQIASVSVPANGSGIQVGLAAAPATGRATPALPVGAEAPGLARTLGVPVTTDAGQMGSLTSRFADGKPYIAGEFINVAGGSCTSGVPAVGNSGGVYMVTAAHCAHTGVHISDGHGTFMGTVVNYSTHWDTAVYYVGSNAVRDDNADEFDGPPSTTHYLPLRNTHYSYNGQYVCQDGDTSGVVCGIRVANQDTTQCFPAEIYPGFCARGVLGSHRGTAVRPGDSGGLVFCVCAGSNPQREVRGSVTGWVGNDSQMFWTESLDTYNAFHIHLNPNT